MSLLKKFEKMQQENKKDDFILILYSDSLEEYELLDNCKKYFPNDSIKGITDSHNQISYAIAQNCLMDIYECNKIDEVIKKEQKDLKIFAIKIAEIISMLKKNSKLDQIILDLYNTVQEQYDSKVASQSKKTQSSIVELGFNASVVEAEFNKLINIDKKPNAIMEKFVKLIELSEEIIKSKKNKSFSLPLRIINSMDSLLHCASVKLLSDETVYKSIYKSLNTIDSYVNSVNIINAENFKILKIKLNSISDELRQNMLIGLKLEPIQIYNLGQKTQNICKTIDDKIKLSVKDAEKSDKELYLESYVDENLDKIEKIYNKDMSITNYEPEYYALFIPKNNLYALEENLFAIIDKKGKIDSYIKEKEFYEKFKFESIAGVSYNKVGDKFYNKKGDKVFDINLDKFYSLGSTQSKNSNSDIVLFVKDKENENSIFIVEADGKNPSKIHSVNEYNMSILNAVAFYSSSLNSKNADGLIELIKSDSGGKIKMQADKIMQYLSKENKTLLSPLKDVLSTKNDFHKIYDGRTNINIAYRMYLQSLHISEKIRKTDKTEKTIYSFHLKEIKQFDDIINVENFDDIKIKDMLEKGFAQLFNEYRFNGGIAHSVGVHTYNVARLIQYDKKATHKEILAAYLHDFAETLTGDINGRYLALPQNRHIVKLQNDMFTNLLKRLNANPQEINFDLIHKADLDECMLSMKAFNLTNNDKYVADTLSLYVKDFINNLEKQGEYVSDDFFYKTKIEIATECEKYYRGEMAFDEIVSPLAKNYLEDMSLKISENELFYIKSIDELDLIFDEKGDKISEVIEKFSHDFNQVSPIKVDAMNIKTILNGKIGQGEARDNIKEFSKNTANKFSDIISQDKMKLNSLNESYDEPSFLQKKPRL